MREIPAALVARQMQHGAREADFIEHDVATKQRERVVVEAHIVDVDDLFAVHRYVNVAERHSEEQVSIQSAN